MLTKYSDDFKARVLAAFDPDIRLQEMLDGNSEVVGRILDDSRQMPFDAEEILDCLDRNVGLLRKKAQQVALRAKLYREWCAQYGGMKKTR